MKANQINAAALANTAREVIAMCDNKKNTVAKIIAHWNLCVEQAGMTGSFDCPTCYKRKASIVGDMQRIALQLDRIADDRDPLTGDRNSINDPRCDDEGNDPREWCGNDIEAAHAEALEINEAVGIAGRVIQAMKGVDIDCIMAGIRGGMYRSGLNDINAVAVMAICIEINRAHLEAFEINAQVDSALVDLAVTIARLPEGADCGRHCINSLEFIDKSYGVVIHPRMLADLVDRASK
ncbi:hypothetical protein HAX39_23820 [Citrobacter freundii]|nr:hypothetical protein [Citrobacter freundii]